MAPTTLPRTRTLTVLGQDPSVTFQGGALTVELEIPAERVTAGPRSARVHVIDYDTTTDSFYRPFVIGDRDAYSGVTDTQRLVADPGFHAQNVFAIVTATLARFEFALGRRVPWSLAAGSSGPGAAPGRGHVLKVAPHAFSEANAFYSRRDEGLMFGYFPGEHGNVFTCLSHDVVAHETSHALLDGLRPRFSDPSSPDQAAFHEGFSDVVALLSVFRHERVVRAALPALPQGRVVPPGSLSVEALKQSLLMGLAKQMGREMPAIRGDALRRSAQLPPDRNVLAQEEFQEPHRRGEVFVAAMMNSFLGVWVRRLGPLGLDAGRGVDQGRLIEEGAGAAKHLLTMVIRALDYTPPVDLQFSDYLSALLTADHELNPDDSKFGYRAALIEGFARYGIAPVATKGTPELGLWGAPTVDLKFDRSHFESMREDPDEVFRFIWENYEALELDPDAYTYVPSVRRCTRMAADGFPVRETLAEYVQIVRIQAGELASMGVRMPKGMPAETRVQLYGGGALVFDEYGRLKFQIASNVFSRKQTPRLEYLWEIGHFSERRSSVRRFSELHRERAMRAPRNRQERW